MIYEQVLKREELGINMAGQKISIQEAEGYKPTLNPRTEKCRSYQVLIDGRFIAAYKTEAEARSAAKSDHIQFNKFSAVY